MAAPPVAENFQLKWHSFGSHLHASVATLLHSETFADVVLSTADGRHVSAHRFVLAACSSYLQGLLGPGSLAANGHLPVVVIMPSEISHHTLCTLIKYMYSGEATVSHTQLDAVLRAGDILRIRGLYRPPGPRACGAREKEANQPHHLLRTLEGYTRARASMCNKRDELAAGLGVHRHFMDPTRTSSESQLSQEVSPRMHRTYLEGTRLARRSSREQRDFGKEIRDRKKELRRRERLDRVQSVDRLDSSSPGHPQKESRAKEQVEPEVKTEVVSMDTDTESNRAVVAEDNRAGELEAEEAVKDKEETDRRSNSPTEREAPHPKDAEGDGGKGESADAGGDVPPLEDSGEADASPSNKENHARSRSRNTNSRTNGEDSDGRNNSDHAGEPQTLHGGIGALANLVVGEMKIKEEPIEWDMESEVRQALLEDLPSGVRVKPEQPEDGAPGRGELMYSPLTCDFCNQTFFCPGDWVRHTETQHAEMRRRPRRRAPKGRLSSHDSDRSGQSASTSSDAYRPGSGSGSGSGSAVLTGGSTPGSGVTSASPSRTNYPELVCDVCHETFGSPGAWARHLQTNHTDEELAMHNKKNPTHQQYIRQFPLKSARRCGLCSKSFLSKASLQIHRRTHTGERPYLCHHCDKGFNVKSNFLRHMRTVHNRVISPTSAQAAQQRAQEAHAASASASTSGSGAWVSAEDR